MVGTNHWKQPVTRYRPVTAGRRNAGGLLTQLARSFHQPSLRREQNTRVLDRQVRPSAALIRRPKRSWPGRPQRTCASCRGCQRGRAQVRKRQGTSRGAVGLGSCRFVRGSPGGRGEVTHVYHPRLLTTTRFRSHSRDVNGALSALLHVCPGHRLRRWSRDLVRRRCCSHRPGHGQRSRTESVGGAGHPTSPARQG